MQQMVDQAHRDPVVADSADIVEFGRLLHESWMLKRTLSDRVSNVDRSTACTRRPCAPGAVGGKLLGAGGGGFMLLFVRPEDRARVRDALGDLIAVPFRFEIVRLPHRAVSAGRAVECA